MLLSSTITYFKFFCYKKTTLLGDQPACLSVSENQLKIVAYIKSINKQNNNRKWQSFIAIKQANLLKIKVDCENIICSEKKLTILLQSYWSIFYREMSFGKSLHQSTKGKSKIVCENVACKIRTNSSLKEMLAKTFEKCYSLHVFVAASTRIK